MISANRSIQSLLFSRLPVASISIWALVTAWFTGRQCDQSAVIGLSFVAAILGLLLWCRASVSVYNARKLRRSECTTWFWKLLAILESSTIGLLFLTVVLTTPPGSTCLLPAATGTVVQETTLYSMLTIAVLGAFIAPQLLQWALTSCEALGIQARGEPSVPVTDPGFSAHRGDHWLVHSYAGIRALLHSDRVQRLLWQLLPTTAVPLYKVVTAGRANDALATACTPDERNWLLALIAVCGTVSLFLNLESYERHWDEPEEVACDPTRSLYRKSWLYNVWAIMQSLFTTTAFVGVALLTPPAGPCLFPSTRTSTLLQNLSLMILLPMAGVALVLVVLRGYLATRGGSGEEVELSQRLSGSRMPTSKAGAAISGYAITAAAPREREDMTLDKSYSLPVV